MTAMTSAVARGEPIPAASGENDRAANGNARSGRRVSGGVEQDRLDVQVFRAVIVITASAKDQRAGQHDDRGDPADDQNRQALGTMRAFG